MELRIGLYPVASIRQNSQKAEQFSGQIQIFNDQRSLVEERMKKVTEEFKWVITSITTSTPARDTTFLHIMTVVYERKVDSIEIPDDLLCLPQPGS
jgi:hypothetical protein